MIVTKRTNIKEVIDELVEKLGSRVEVLEYKNYYGRVKYKGCLINIRNFRPNMISLKSFQVVYDGDFTEEEINKYISKMAKSVDPNKNPEYITLDEFYKSNGVASEKVVA
jgi:hypothetical protein